MTTKKTRKINRPYLSIPITLDEVISSLVNTDDPVSSSHLAELSDLSSESFLKFRDAWNELGPERRYNIILRLKDLAEDNVELNFDVILKLGLDDEDPQIRLVSINGLWENRQNWLQRKLIAIALEDESEEVRICSVQALERFCLDAELNNKQDAKQQLANILLSIFNNPDKSNELRRRSLEAVSPLGLAEVHTAIKEAFQNDNREFKLSAVYSMGVNCNPSWLTILMPQLQNNDAELRYEAACACGEIGEEDAVNALIPLLEDDDRDVQLAAIEALGKIGGKESKEALNSLLESPDELLRDAAQQSIYELELYHDPFSPEILELDKE